jgi:hypothetical protein
MSKIKTYTVNDLELHTLELFARLVNTALSQLNDDRYSMRVKDMYFDFGQDWKYTGLLTTDEKSEWGNDGWQSFCPRDYELILDTDSIEKLSQMAVYYATELVNGKISINLYNRFE